MSFPALNYVLIGKVLWINHFIILNFKHNDFLGWEKGIWKWNLSEGWWTDKKEHHSQNFIEYLRHTGLSVCQRKAQMCFPGMKPEKAWVTGKLGLRLDLGPHFLSLSFLPLVHHYLVLFLLFLVTLLPHIPFPASLSSCNI